ncbi:MAG: CPBP family intramembrane metalloprotease [Propionibacteriaceae bacterium]|jgi:membrane protease YdiL (CAAX protease family)|nr:CPBP family intramembrane metalloprotease [Propionibacteriaceae bacterium]
MSDAESELKGKATTSDSAAENTATESAGPILTSDSDPAAETSSAPRVRRLIGIEIVIVMAISLGRSAVYSVISLIEKLTRPIPLNQQTTSMNNSATPDRPWLDLAYQVYYFILPLAEAALALYLLHLAWGQARRLIGFDLTHFWRDLGKGLAICAVVGSVGIGWYLFAVWQGINTQVTAANLTDVWWRIPILLGSAAAAGISEEVIMLGYLLTRLRDLKWNPWVALVFSALIRGTYHLYQGWGGAIGNLVMGLVFGYLYMRWKRVLPLVIAHFFMDAFAFVGYALLAPLVDWL